MDIFFDPFIEETPKSPHSLSTFTISSNPFSSPLLAGFCSTGLHSMPCIWPSWPLSPWTSILLWLLIADLPHLLHLYIPQASLDDLSSSCFQLPHLDTSVTPKSVFPDLSPENPIAVHKPLCRAPKILIQKAPKLVSFSSFLFLESLSLFPTLVNVTVVQPAVQASSKQEVHVGHSGPTLIVSTLEMAALWSPLLP